MRATDPPGLRPATRLPRPVVVGHRGAPAYRPEHTLASFELAIDLGADFVEPDVVVSRDGALVVRHERDLSLTTDIATRREFAHRRTTKVLGGRPRTDWFVEDFDLRELRTLRAVERLPHLRPANAAYDGHFGLVTLDEVIDLARRRSTPGRTIGVLVELSPGLGGVGRNLPRLIAAELRRIGAHAGGGSVMLQAFEPEALRWLRHDLGDDGPRMIQLVDDTEDDDWFLTDQGLAEISTYAQAIGPSRRRVLVRGGRFESPSGTSDLVHRSHDADLDVFVWTLHPENAFLPPQLRRGGLPTAHGNAYAEASQLLDMGVTGLIADAPDTSVRAVSDRALVLAA